MEIGKFNTDEEVLIVAEIGNNHEGNFEVAKSLVHKAAECGVDAVKFQTFKTEYFVSRTNIARFNRLKSFELSFSQFEQLAKLSKSLGLIFLSTPLDLISAEFLESIVDCYKIASGDNTFYPLIRQIARTGKPLIISSGLSNFQEVEQTVTFVKQHWVGKDISDQLAILHCVSSYPVSPEQANLRSIPFLSEKLACTIGYSDHTIGIDAALLAIALGARIIEKHFTLDRNFSDFRDHQLSADPSDMTALVQRVRLASSMLGQYGKIIRPCEEVAIRSTRRSIVANKNLLPGHCLTNADFTWMRPQVGLVPGQEDLLVGKHIKRKIDFGEPLHVSDTE